MATFIFQKLVQVLLVAWGVLTLLFLLFTLLGNPAQALASQRTDAQTMAALQHELGLDKPVWWQYLAYLHDLSPVGVLDSAQRAGGFYTYIGVWDCDSAEAWVLKLPYMRRSFVTGRPVAEAYFERFPATLALACSALLVAGLFGIGGGILAGRSIGSGVDRAMSVVAMLGVSAPAFLAAVLLVWWLAIEWGPYTGLPVAGYWLQPHVFQEGWALSWRHLVLPVITLGIRPMAILFQLSRDSVAVAMREDYVRTARAKGLAEWRVVANHAVRNALNPVLTALTGWLSSLLAGAFFIEYVFDWPGVGKLTLDALFMNDYPVLLGCTLATGLLFAFLNMWVDVLYALLDPRLRQR